jgi:hypothetical protein
MKIILLNILSVISISSYAGIDIKGKASVDVNGKPPKMTVGCKGTTEDCVKSSSIRLPDGTYGLKVEVFKNEVLFKSIIASTMKVLVSTETETKVEFAIIE